MTHQIRWRRMTACSLAGWIHPRRVAKREWCARSGRARRMKLGGWHSHTVRPEPRSLETIRYLVHPDCVRRGCARELTKALKRHYSGVFLSTSPASPTRLGRATMLQLHREGYIDSLSFDLESLNSDELEDEDNSEIWASVTKVDCPCSEG